MKAVVTGCAGLFGSHMACFLLDRGWSVLGIDDLSGGYTSNLPTDESFRFIKEDLNHYKTIRTTIKAYAPQVIYHFAAYAAEGLSPFMRRHNYIQNLVATSSVINCAIEADAKLVFTSSMAVYGEQSPPFVESMELRPVDPYGIAKSAAEMDIRMSAKHLGLKYSIVRPHNVIGVKQNIWDKYRNVIGIFIRRALLGQPLLIFGDGLQLRAFSDIQFYMNPLEKLAHSHDGETYNLGADKPVTVLAAAEMIREKVSSFGIKATIKHVEPRLEVKEAFCDHSKAKNDLAFADNTNLEATIEAMLQWARTQPHRDVRVQQYEISRGLYDFWK